VKEIVKGTQQQTIDAGRPLTVVSSKQLLYLTSGSLNVTKTLGEGRKSIAHSLSAPAFLKESALFASSS
jgi:hypothetical protein